MSVDDLLKKTLQKANDTSSIFEADCGHSISVNYMFTHSGTKIGLKPFKTFTACSECSHIILDKTHNKHEYVKILIRKKINK